MKMGKRLMALLLGLLVSLSAAACTRQSQEEVPGEDWRTRGTVQGSGIITRSGEDTPVLVCVHQDGASFYYDTREQTPCGGVDYPCPFPGDAQEAFRYVDFADRNGDGCSDVSMLFEGDILMVWYWDGAQGAFVFRPEESQVPEDPQP